MGAGVGSGTGKGVGSRTHVVPSQQEPTEHSQYGTSSLESGGQPHAPMLQVMGYTCPSQQRLSDIVPPPSVQISEATGAEVGSGIGRGAGSGDGIGVGFKPGPSLQQPSLQSQKSVTVYVASTTC